MPLLARQAEVLRAEADFLDGLARAAWPPGDGTTPAAVLAAMPLVLGAPGGAVLAGQSRRPPSPKWSVCSPSPAATLVPPELSGGRGVRRSGGQLRVEPPR